MSVTHKAKALKIKCIDYRFEEAINADSSARRFTGKADEISWPGASQDFENVSQAAALSIKLHDPDEVYIYEHEDCGAYQENNSLETHRENANKLKSYLKGIKPRIKVTALIVTFNGIREI